MSSILISFVALNFCFSSLFCDKLRLYGLMNLVHTNIFCVILRPDHVISKSQKLIILKTALDT